MKRQFWAYYLPSQKQFEELWAAAFFTVDSSVLLANELFSDERSLGAPYSEERLRARYDEGRTRFQSKY